MGWGGVDRRDRVLVGPDGPLDSPLEDYRILISVFRCK